jgi:hypothetical protein
MNTIEETSNLISEVEVLLRPVRIGTVGRPGTMGTVRQNSHAE